MFPKKKLSDIAIIYNGNSINKTVKQQNYMKDVPGWNYIGTKDVGFDGTVTYKTGVIIPFTETKFRTAPAGTVFVCSEGGSAGKKTALIQEEVCFGNKLYAIVNRDNIFIPKYVYYYTRYEAFLKQFKLMASTLMGGITAKNFGNIQLPLPEISEQKRIVSRIEELFSLLDNAVEALQKTKEQLAVYRQAVLKEVLGSQGDCNSTLGEVILYLQNGLSKRKGTDGKDIVVLRLANIDNEKILDLSEMRTIMLTDKEQESYLLNEGDGLIVRVNGSMNRVGRMVLVSSSGTNAFCDHLIRCVFDRGKIEPQYAKYLLDDAVSRKHIKDNVVSTAGQNTISQGTIKSCPIYLPSLENQREMIQEIDSRLPMCDSIEQTVDIAILQAEAMRQSILKEAFEGRL